MRKCLASLFALALLAGHAIAGFTPPASTVPYQPQNNAVQVFGPVPIFAGIRDSYTFTPAPPIGPAQFVTLPKESAAVVGQKAASQLAWLKFLNDTTTAALAWYTSHVQFVYYPLSVSP